MEDLKARAEAIKAWHKRALSRVATRLKRSIDDLGRLTPEDAKVYERLIDEHFQKLRKEHNARVAAARERR